MSDIGIVRGAAIGKGYRSEKDVVLLEVEISDPRDVQSVEYLFSQGDCAVPVTGDTVLIHEVYPEYKVATASNFGVVVASLTEGERSVFAVKDGEVAAVIDFLSSGELVLNKGEDYAVMYSELKSAFEELQGQHNNLVDDLIAWVPAPTDGGTALKTLITASATALELISIGDITKSKVEMVRV